MSPWGHDLVTGLHNTKQQHGPGASKLTKGQGHWCAGGKVARKGLLLIYGEVMCTSGLGSQESTVQCSLQAMESRAN